jgi:hypothetical protein
MVEIVEKHEILVVVKEGEVAAEGEGHEENGDNVPGICEPHASQNLQTTHSDGHTCRY